MMDPDEELAAYRRDAKAGRIPGIGGQSRPDEARPVDGEVRRLLRLALESSNAESGFQYVADALRLMEGPTHLHQDKKTATEDGGFGR
jgi:hypothetical protein